MRVDAHHHLWHYTPEKYGWIDDSMRRLRRDFLPGELAEEAASAGVSAVIAVQARQTLEETRWLLELAAESSLIAGVVGWAPIASAEFPATLAALLGNPLLKGLRHVVQAEPPGFLDDSAFNRGVAALAATSLVYDILIRAGQLPEVIRFVDRHPEQQFVLDHIAKPDIAHKVFEPWNSQIRELAGRANVACKISGMVTEADFHTWNPEQLRPYFDTVLEAFSPSRLMVGSDWPVLTVACTYSQWWQSVAGWLAPLSHEERAAVESGTAVRIYQLATENLEVGTVA